MDKSRRYDRNLDRRTGRHVVSEIDAIIARKVRQAARREYGIDVDADAALSDEDVDETDEVNCDDPLGVFAHPDDVVTQEDIDDPPGDGNAAAEDRTRTKQGETKDERAQLHTAVDDLDATEAAATPAPTADRRRSSAEAEKQVRQDRQRQRASREV